MAGRRRKRAKLLAETHQNSNRVSNLTADYEQDSNLPMEILELILSQLSLKDNIRASSVCKRWLAAAISVQKADKPPWLMQFPKSGNMYEFYDLLKRKSYYLKLPQLQGAEIYYAKDGWLMCFKQRTRRVFLFHPYSQELVKFPKLNMAFQLLAFSAPPTSPNCILITVNPVTENPPVSITVAISTCRPGDTEWTTVNYANSRSYICTIENQVIFCNGHFYFVSITGSIGVYNPEGHTWGILPYYLPECRYMFLHNAPGEQRMLAEHQGDIYVVYARSPKSTTVYKWDVCNGKCKRMEDLRGSSVFVNLISSHVRMDLLGNLRDKIYFPKIEYYGNRCVTYSVREERFYPSSKGFDLRQLEYSRNVWIDSPEDLSVFL